MCTNGKMSEKILKKSMVLFKNLKFVWNWQKITNLYIIKWTKCYFSLEENVWKDCKACTTWKKYFFNIQRKSETSFFEKHIDLWNFYHTPFSVYSKKI